MKRKEDLFYVKHVDVLFLYWKKYILTVRYVRKKQKMNSQQKI